MKGTVKKLKPKTDAYSVIYCVSYPCRFYFNKDGTYDGLEFETIGITDEEAFLIEELLDKLPIDE